MHSVAQARRHVAPAAFLLTLALFFVACSPKGGEVIVAKVGNQPITLQEYEQLYIKSNGGNREQAAASSQEDREKFLGLMTKFRLKLTDAYRRGLDKDTEVKKEIAHYRGSLAQSYLTEREVVTPGVRKLYQRRTEEVRASHILISLGSNASPSDSEKAYTKANEIIAALKAGGDFSLLALEHSQDPSVKQNKGDLYFFTAGRMVAAFEDAVYALRPGEFSLKPVRTIYGVHVIKVTDRQPNAGERRVSHIMIRFEKQDPSPEDTLAAYAKIKAIQDSVARGIDFAELATRNSGDPGSSPQGGDLGWFSRGRWPRPFDDTCFVLKNGQVSDIVRTVYGYHLIKCFDSRPLKSFDELRKDLQQTYQQNLFQGDYQTYLARLKRELGFSMNDSIVTLFVASIDSNKTPRDSAWASGVSPALSKAAIMSFRNRLYSTDTVMAIIATRPDINTQPLRAASLRTSLDKVAEQLTYNVKGETLEQQDRDFAILMKEYMDGILLYQVEQDQVWGRIAVNDSLLQGYFAQHREKFTYPDRVHFSEIRATNDSLAALIARQLDAGSSMEEIAVADSLRMSAPTTFTIAFDRRAANVPPKSMKALAEFCSGVTADRNISLRTTVQTDSSDKATAKLAARRLAAVKSALTKGLRIPTERILAETVQMAPASASMKPAQKDSVAGQVKLEILGRLPVVQGRISTELLPVTTDERTKRADSLAVGAHSAPFTYRGYYSIVRLNKKEPARQKTYEEAGTEVSSAFQDYESKRLENEWLDGLRKQYPVAENKEELKKAFGSAQ